MSEHVNDPMSVSVTGSEQEWSKACLRAAENDDFFGRFRSSETFTRVVEGTPTLAGRQLLTRCLHNPVFAEMLPHIASQDLVASQAT